MDMTTLRALMAKRVAGIPVMAIAAVIAGAILFVVYRRRNAASADTTDTSSEDTPTGDTGPEDDTQQPVFQAVTSVSTPPESDTDDGTGAAPSISTNAEWGREATNWLITQGFTVDVASSAISKYLAGQSLSADEKVARDKAVTNFGVPPQNLPGTPAGPDGKGSNAPASKQGEPPLRHTVMGTRDNTPAELARLYYGTNSTDATNKIKAANDTQIAPYHVGARIFIPEKYEPKYFDATAHIDTEYEIARRNNTTADKILALNPHLTFPVKSGTRVRVH